MKAPNTFTEKLPSEELILEWDGNNGTFDSEMQNEVGKWDLQYNLIGTASRETLRGDHETPDEVRVYGQSVYIMNLQVRYDGEVLNPHQYEIVYDQAFHALCCAIYIPDVCVY